MNMDRTNVISNSDGHSAAELGGAHTFHIPIMGTGFTVDTPVRVARYGITSVVTIGDDILLEAMRKQLSVEFGKPFIAVEDSHTDPRGARVAAYLNLLDEIVKQQIEVLRNAPFEPGSGICRYFELLPESSAKQTYQRMMSTSDSKLRSELQDTLRSFVSPGSIDVNIMTKVDGPLLRKGLEQTPDQTVAVSALRGFARTGLRSSIVFSAGMNRRLFKSLEQYDDFYPTADGDIKKKICLKVSDFRSAQIQGKLLASRGIWVSEYRIESGLNCGGHAFPSKGHLMGPILEEFRVQRQSLRDKLYKSFVTALKAKDRPAPSTPPKTRFTVQGGIGTPEEDSFLRRYYEIDGTGWGTPFLLVPEVTNVDPDMLDKLTNASETDVYLSDASPLGVPFWNLRTSASEDGRRQRIEKGAPGSPCPKGFLRLNTEYGDEPLCTASRAYQRKKLIEIADNSDLNTRQRAECTKKVLAKTCIGHELSGSAAIKHGFDSSIAPAVCPGPGILDYSKVSTLDEMVDHIYGRLSLLSNSERPHMFVRELGLYIDYLKEELEKSAEGLIIRTGKYFGEFRENLTSGIDYYRDLADKFSSEQRERFLDDLNSLGKELSGLISDMSVASGSLTPAIATRSTRD